MRYDVNEETGKPSDLADLLTELKQSKAPVAVFAAADTDGLGAAQILMTVLKRESVRYQQKVFRKITELQDELDKLRINQQCTKAVLLNCGALLDLSRWAPAAGGSSRSLEALTIFVFDSHRPINHLNLLAPQVVVFDDDVTFIPPPLRNPDFPLSADDSSSSPRAKRGRYLSPRIESDDGSDEEFEGLEEYYRGSYYALPVSLLLYQVALAYRLHTPESLWLVCVAVSSYFESGYISQNQYLALAHDVEQKFLGDFQSEESKRKGSVVFGEELRLVLVRHWSVQESFQASPYVFSKLELHRDHGKRQLQQLLALAGIPPDEYSQMFCSMSLPLRQKLKANNSKFKKACRTFSLNDINHFEFSRSTRLGDEENPSISVNELCASDAFHAVTLALEDAKNDVAIDLMSGAASAGNMRKCILQALDWRRAIASQVKMILDRRSSKVKDGVRFFKIERPASFVFAESASATRQLAVFLWTVYKHRTAAAEAEKGLPVIVAVKNVSRYLCVGIDPDNIRNDFVDRYTRASKLCGIVESDKNCNCIY